MCRLPTNSQTPLHTCPDPKDRGCCFPTSLHPPDLAHSTAQLHHHSLRGLSRAGEPGVQLLAPRSLGCYMMLSGWPDAALSEPI